MEGHSSLFNCILPLHKILENYFGIAFKASCILSVLSKFRYFFETGIWCQIQVKTDKFVNTIFKQGTNTKLVACYLNEL